MSHHSFFHEVSTEARALLQKECAASSNRFGLEFFEEHLVPVVEFGVTLAHRIGADPFVVEVAAWLHDRAAILDFGTLPNHAHEGAVLARRWLATRGLPETLQERIALCIETHGAPSPSAAVTLEQRCLSNADVLSHLARPTYWFWYLFHVRNLDVGGARAWYRSRLSHWAVLEPAAREMVRVESATLQRLLDGSAVMTRDD